VGQTARFRYRTKKVSTVTDRDANGDKNPCGIAILVNGEWQCPPEGCKHIRDEGCFYPQTPDEFDASQTQEDE